MKIFLKRCLSELMHFRNYGLRSTWLFKCLRSPLSEVPSRSNMVRGTKHCWNMSKTTFTIFLDHCEGNLDGKPLLVICKILGLFVKTLNAGQRYSLLNRANLKKPIQMQYLRNKNIFSICFCIFQMQNKFWTIGYNYLRKRKHFLNFFVHFWNAR